MKNLSGRLFVTLAGIALMMSACKKEKKEAITPAGSTAQTEQYSSVNDFYRKNNVKSQYFTMNASNGATIVGEKGSRITFPASALKDKSGNKVTGNVKIELKEILSAKDMLLSGVLPVSNGNPLMSGGEIFIKITKENGSSQRVAIVQDTSMTAQDSVGIIQGNEDELVLQDSVFIQVQIPADTLINTMQLFQGNTYNSTAGDVYNNSINWTVMNNVSAWTNNVSGFTTPFQGYFFTCHQLNWINVDSFMSGIVSGNQQIELGCMLPESVHDNDTKLYLYYNKINCIFPIDGVMGSYKNGNLYTTWEVVAGMNITIVGISTDKNGKLYNCFHPIKVVPGTSVMLDFNECTADGFKQQMDALD